MGSRGSQGTAIPVVEIELTPQCLLNTRATDRSHPKNTVCFAKTAVYPQKFTVLVDARKALLHHKNVHSLLGN